MHASRLHIDTGGGTPCQGLWQRGENELRHAAVNRIFSICGDRQTHSCLMRGRQLEKVDVLPCVEWLGKETGISTRLHVANAACCCICTSVANYSTDFDSR